MVGDEKSTLSACYNARMLDKVTNKNEKVVEKLLSGTAGEKFQGKQVVVIGEKPHILPDNDQESVALVDKLEQKLPGQIPRLRGPVDRVQLLQRVRLPQGGRAQR